MKRLLAIVAAVIVMAAVAGIVTGFASRPPAWQPPALDAQAVPVHITRPLDNDASAGRVVFTFDDGPDCYTPALLETMHRLHIRGVFFVFGYKADWRPGLIRAEVKAGDLVENHSWDHPSFTGASTDTKPLASSKIRAELASATTAIMKAGAPRPVLYRPPFGDISAADNAIAARLGLRMVQPFAVVPHSNVVDSRDWTGISARRIAHDVEYGYFTKQGRMAGLKQGARVVGFHDSGAASCLQGGAPSRYPVNTIRSLPLIVAWMNRHHLGVTTVVPPAYGGSLP